MNRRERLALALIGAAVALVIMWWVWANRWNWIGFWQWTGFIKFGTAGHHGVYPVKTLWDWMQLLVIPVVLAVVGIAFNQAQKKRELEIAKANREQDLEIAKQDREADRVTAVVRQEGLTLGTYLVHA